MKPHKFTKSWRTSTKPRKQRLYLARTPLHLKQKLMRTHLAPALRTKYSLRNAQLHKGDKVKIMRGQNNGKEGKVERIDLKRGRVFVAGIEAIKKDGTKLQLALQPSNLMITELNLDDKIRKQKLESSKKNVQKTKAEGKK